MKIILRESVVDHGQLKERFLKYDRCYEKAVIIMCQKKLCVVARLKVYTNVFI